MKQPSKEQQPNGLTVQDTFDMLYVFTQPDLLADKIDDLIENGLLRYEMKKIFVDVARTCRRASEQVLKNIDKPTADQYSWVQIGYLQHMRKAHDELERISFEEHERLLKEQE